MEPASWMTEECDTRPACSRPIDASGISKLAVAVFVESEVVPGEGSGPDGLVTEGPVCAHELDTSVKFDFLIPVTPLRCLEIFGAVCTPRDTSTLDGLLLHVDLWRASKCVSLCVVDTGPIPHIYFEAEPHSSCYVLGEGFSELTDCHGHPDNLF